MPLFIEFLGIVQRCNQPKNTNERFIQINWIYKALIGYSMLKLTITQRNQTDERAAEYQTAQTRGAS